MDICTTICISSLCLIVLLGAMSTLGACVRSAQISEDRRQAGLEDNYGNPTLEDMTLPDPFIQYTDPL